MKALHGQQQGIAVTLSQARAWALQLPGAAEAPHHAAASFRVDGKIFATVPPDGTHLNILVDDAAREQALAMDPQAFETLFWGARAAGVSVLLAEAERGSVELLLESAWRRKAGKKAVAAWLAGKPA